jgi:hypothetical protein
MVGKLGGTPVLSVADADVVAEVVHFGNMPVSLRYFGEIQFTPMPASENHPG